MANCPTETEKSLALKTASSFLETWKVFVLMATHCSVSQPWENIFPPCLALASTMDIKTTEVDMVAKMGASHVHLMKPSFLQQENEPRGNSFSEKSCFQDHIIRGIFLSRYYSLRNLPSPPKECA